MSSAPGTHRNITWKTGAAALVLSVLAHMGLFRMNPNLFIGPGDAPFQVSRAAPLPPVILDDLQLEARRRDLPLLLDEFGFLEVQEEAPVEQSAVPEWDPSVFEELTPESLGEEVQLPAPEQRMPELPEPQSDWQPREEVLALSQMRAVEEIASLPRAPRSDHTEAFSVPDILPPVEWSPDAVPAPVGTVLPAIPEASALDRIGARGMPGLPEGIPGGTGGQLAMPDWIPPPLVPVESEGIPDQEDLEAVEQLLRLSSQSYVDPNRPDVRYFKIQLLPAGLEQLPVLPRQVVFLLDCSASMTQPMLQEAVRGIQNALNTLNPQDTVNLIAFRDEVDVLFAESMPADPVRLAAVRGRLAQLRAFGHTDVFASLKALKELPDSEDRPLISMLITDGIPTMGLTDSSEIIEGFTRANQNRISFFSIGGGRQVNRFLLDLLSFRNRGDSLVAERNLQLPAAVERMAAEVRRPVMMDLSHRFTQAGTLDVYPRSLTHLYLDRPLILVGRAPIDQREIAFQIVGRSAEGRHDMIYTLDLASLPPGPWSLRQEWAWQAVLDRVGRFLETRSEETLEELRRISREYRIPVPYADDLPLR